MRRLESRIGTLLGKATPNGKGSGLVTDNPDLSSRQRHDFRQMAAHPDTVEQVVNDSTDNQHTVPSFVTDGTVC
jgi:hypothetical protein